MLVIKQRELIWGLAVCGNHKLNKCKLLYTIVALNRVLIDYNFKNQYEDSTILI